MFNIYCKGAIISYSSSELVYKAGMVATFTGFREVGICRPHMVPAGFFINDSDTLNFNSVCSPRVGIAIGFGEYETDVYENNEYQVRDLLYCSENGKITNNSYYRSNPIIGIVNGFRGNVFFISIFSNLESVFNFFEKEKEPETPVNKGVSGKFNRYTALLNKF